LISEVGSWFQDPVLHVGHDEINARAYKLVPEAWDEVPFDALFPMMREFEPKLLKMLAKAKKTYAAWDDVADQFGIEDIVPKNGLIGVWQGPTVERVNKMAEQGFNNIILSPSDTYYLDCSPSARWCSSDYERTIPATKYDIPGFATFTGQWHNWTMIYNYDPLAGLTPKAQAAIKGGQGSLWTETIKRHNVDRFTFPRASVIGEKLWSYANAKFDGNTAKRLARFRASLINELQIDAAALDYLGNGEDMVYRTEMCDGAGMTAANQKTNECCFPGEPLTGGNGGELQPPYGSHFADPTDYCRIAGKYITNQLVHAVPAKVSYGY